MDIEHPGVFVEEVALAGPAITAAPTATTAFVGSFPAGSHKVATDVHSAQQFTELFDKPGAGTEASVAVHDFFANGGRHAVVVPAVEPGRHASSQQLLDALKLIAPAQREWPHAQLVCVPDMGRRFEPLSHGDYAQLVAGASMFCRQSRMFLLVDANTPADDLTDVETWLRANAAWGSPNNALYFPRLQTPASRAAGLATGPVSGAVAGVMARTDARRGVWKSPAGIEATIDGRVATAFSDQDQSPLNRHGVNLIRERASTTVIWGARTGAGSVASEYRYVPVRRTALFLEHSLHQGLQWAAFEPGGEPLWARIQASVNAFLESLWRAGAFVGQTSGEAFFARCGHTTMTRVDRRRGRTVVQVGFAPLKPAEFVTLTVQIDRG